MKEEISIPNATRTFKALRSLGYDLNSSIADLVDNSLTGRVNSQNIRIKFWFNKDYEIVLRMVDDGVGMNSDELKEAMRIGAESSYTIGDLGKFGMGMKTASLTHANILTIISKKENSEISGFSWDLGYVKKTGSWTLLKLEKNEINDILQSENLNFSNKGTIVLWDDLFLINNEYSSIKSHKIADNYLFRKIEELKLHLRMVFHRFLDQKSEINHHVNIFVNNIKLIPWDPFFRKEPNTLEVKLSPELSTLYIKDDCEPVNIKAFILPNKDLFSSEKIWKEAKGLLSWNDSQGYYIYRANRIIRFGGWQGTKAKDEHDKLARISIDIDPGLDDEFRITVNKNKVEFPELLFQHLKNLVNPAVIKKAKIQYNKKFDDRIFNNDFRKNPKIQNVSEKLLFENQIKTKPYNNVENNDIIVENPSGTWLSNKISDFMKYGREKDYEVISDVIEDGYLWKIVCNPNDKFKVIINSSHPFYERIYKSEANKLITDALDAFIFSLAFAELYNKNNQNAHLFDTFKLICSNALGRLIKEEIL